MRFDEDYVASLRQGVIERDATITRLNQEIKDFYREVKDLTAQLQEAEDIIKRDNLGGYG